MVMKAGIWLLRATLSDGSQRKCLDSDQETSRVAWLG